MNNFLPSLSPDAIDLSLCAMVVGDSDHNQAEDTGMTEKQDQGVTSFSFPVLRDNILQNGLQIRNPRTKKRYIGF